MKRYMAILGFVFVGILAGLLVRGIPIVLQVNAGGGVPQADRNGDVNGDASIDISDAVYILRHLFSGGPGPVALAQGEPGLAEGINRTNELLEEIAYPCSQRGDRIQSNGDGTVTDECSGLMWFRGSNWVDPMPWEQAVAFCENLEWAGYDDWRLPTTLEIKTLYDGSFISGLVAPMWGPRYSWTSEDTSETGVDAWLCDFRVAIPLPLFRPVEKSLKENFYSFFPVRDNR